MKRWEFIAGSAAALLRPAHLVEVHHATGSRMAGKQLARFFPLPLRQGASLAVVDEDPPVAGTRLG
jgi:hypothetical protein